MLTILTAFLNVDLVLLDIGGRMHEKQILESQELAYV